MSNIHQIATARGAGTLRIARERRHGYLGRVLAWLLLWALCFALIMLSAGRTAPDEALFAAIGSVIGAGALFAPPLAGVSRAPRARHRHLRGGRPALAGAHFALGGVLLAGAPPTALFLGESLGDHALRDSALRDDPLLHRPSPPS